MFDRAKRVFRRLILSPSDGESTSTAAEDSESNTDRGVARVASTEPEATDTDAPPSLYSCPECQQVYVAAEQRTCGACQTSVERIDSETTNWGPPMSGMR
jgi:hypothetical protein